MSFKRKALRCVVVRNTNELLKFVVHAWFLCLDNDALLFMSNSFVDAFCNEKKNQCSFTRGRVALRRRRMSLSHQNGSTL
mmetsp:Transcript_20666/g.35512  ORF Transcript_20666/g.35512 Transcript_20666/m.35512 type:complete len:80 (+) Transcript_20666:476-715(+)